MTDTLPDSQRTDVPAADLLFAGPGEMRALCRAHDWSATSLGPVETWSAPLRSTAQMVMAAGVPMLVFWGPDLVQIFNDAFRPSLGSPPAHVAALGAPGARYWAEIWDQRGPQIRHILSGGEAVQHADVKIPMTRDGRLEDVWWTFTDTPVFGETGSIAGVLVVCQETTAQVRSQQQQEQLRMALELQRARLEDIVRIAPTSVAVLRGPNHIVELTNARFDTLVGGRDVRGRTVAEALPEASAQGFITLLDQVLATGEPFVGREVPYRRPDAAQVEDERFVDFVYQPISETDGTRSGVFVHGVDITEQVRARREVQRLLGESETARERLEAVLGSIADAFYLLDREWRFTFVNAAAEPLLQTTADQLLGRTLWEMFPGVAGSVFEQPYREAMETGRVTSVEAYFGPLGTFFDVRTFPWAGGLMVYFRDIGERKAVEAERERLLQEAQSARADAESARAQVEAANTQLQEQALELEMQAEELQTTAVQLEERSVDLQIEVEAAEAARADAVAANRAKSEFLAIMSHELRTPLNAIDGYAELMELGIRGPITDAQREDLARIRKSEKHLLGLINGVLNYARVEAGAVHYELTQVRLEDVLATCEALVSPQARNKSLTLRRWACDPLLVVRADREKLQQILLNLLSNAIKFTNVGGHIEIRCSLLPRERGGFVQITVSDTGIGIASNQLKRIFEPFVQIDSEFTRTREGTGLGLAISRDLARGMGGELSAQSTLGDGSTFTLVLRSE